MTWTEEDEMLEEAYAQDERNTPPKKLMHKCRYCGFEEAFKNQECPVCGK